MINKLITLLVTITVLVSCSNTPPTVLGNKNYDNKPAVIIIPMDGVDNNLINNISGYIQDKHNLKTKIYPHMGYADIVFNSETEQYYAEVNSVSGS